MTYEDSERLFTYCPRSSIKAYRVWARDMTKWRRAVEISPKVVVIVTVRSTLAYDGGTTKLLVRKAALSDPGRLRT